MKRIALVIAIVLISTIVNSQTVNDIPLKDINVEYVQIVGTSKPFSNKLTIEIDFGQDVKYWQVGKSELQLKDKNGKKIEFNSMIDALNFMSKNGYEFVDSYAISLGQTNVYHYILKKKSLSIQNEASIN